MSFYGNISNAGKTNLTFDKVYPNRAMMENALILQNSGHYSDDVFVGRFVLIEYDDNTFSRRIGYLSSDFLESEAQASDTIPIYIDSTLNEVFLLSSNSIKDGYGLFPQDETDFRYIKTGDIVEVLDSTTNKYYYYVCSGAFTDIAGAAAFTPVVFSGNAYDQITDYMINYHLDKKWAEQYDAANETTEAISTFNEQQGWDSTIWQKIVDNGFEKYSLVGKLNSYMPRLFIDTDAPTLKPMAPHWGTNSTNRQYTLHMQPNWGLRIKPVLTYDETDLESVEAYEELKEQNLYEEVQYNYREYDENTKTDIDLTDTYLGDIYYNKNGFDHIVRNRDDEGTNEVTILPTGKSGKEYFVHDSESALLAKYEEREDIQEISIHLPIIGNAISDMWDLIYGDKVYEEVDGVLKGAYLPERNDDISWGSIDGVRLVKEQGSGFSYSPEKTEVLAGCINSVHDLMGMIVVDDNSKLADADMNHIYYRERFDGSEKYGYYIKTRKNTYVPLLVSDMENYVNGKKFVELTAYEPDKYHIKINTDYHLEEDVRPTSDTNHYLLDTELIHLLPWSNDPEYKDEVDEEGNVESVEILNHFYQNETWDWIKDNSENPDESLTYYTLALTQETFTKEGESWSKKTELFRPINAIQYPENGSLYWKGYLYVETIENGIDETTEEPIYTYKITEIDENSTFNEDFIYYYVPKYLKEISYIEGEDPVITLQWLDTTPMTPETLANTSYGVDLLPWKDQYYYFQTDSIRGTENEGYQCAESPLFYIQCTEESVFDATIQYYEEDGSSFVSVSDLTTELFELDKTKYFYLEDTSEKTFYSIVPEAETGYLEIEESEDEDENEEEEKETVYTHYYKPGIYYYKVGAGHYLLDKGQKLREDSEYYFVDATLLDATFYEAGKYYYYNIQEQLDVLDNDADMKVDGNEFVAEDTEENRNLNYRGPNGEIYYLKQYAYIVNDDLGYLAPGSIWNSNYTDPIPDTLEFGKLYEGEEVVEEYSRDENGNIIINEETGEPELITVIIDDPDERADRMYQWVELTGFARALNTINGLIVKINQFFKWDDELTRDTDTIQGCLNSIKDIINDFGLLIPGESLITDTYGRIVSARTITQDEIEPATESTESVIDQGWIEITTDPSVKDPSITVLHSFAKTPINWLGQEEDEQLKFSKDFDIPYLAVDNKGHVNAEESTTHLLKMPHLVVENNNNGTVFTSWKVEDHATYGQKLVATKSYLGDLQEIVSNGSGNFIKNAEYVPSSDNLQLNYDYFVNLITVKDSDKASKKILSNFTIEEDTITIERKYLSEFATFKYDTLTNSGEQYFVQPKIITNLAYTANSDEISVTQKHLSDLLTLHDNDSGKQVITGLSLYYDSLVIAKENIGNFLLTGYEVATAASSISATDKLNEALGKLEYKLNILNAGATQEGSVAYQIAQIVNADNNDKIDKLNEIAAWIVNDTTGAAKMNADIIANANAIAALQEVGGESNVQSDWTETDTTSDAFIVNKPDLTNMVQTTSTFTYNGESKNIQEMFDYIKTLEDRLAALGG